MMDLAKENMDDTWGSEPMSQTSLVPPPSSSGSKHDRIASAVLRKFSELKSGSPVHFGKIILAGFVLEKEELESDSDYAVVSIGTGKHQYR